MNSDKTQARLNKLSDISSDIAQVTFASIVIPFFLDRFNPLMLALGIVITVGFWTLSLILRR